MTAEEVKLWIDGIFETGWRLTRVELLALLKALAQVDEQASDDAADGSPASEYHAGRYSGFILARSLVKQLEIKGVRYAV